MFSRGLCDEVAAPRPLGQCGWGVRDPHHRDLSLAVPGNLIIHLHVQHTTFSSPTFFSCSCCELERRPQHLSILLACPTHSITTTAEIASEA